jgi:hypothetical protein
MLTQGSETGLAFFSFNGRKEGEQRKKEKRKEKENETGLATSIRMLPTRVFPRHSVVV